MPWELARLHHLVYLAYAHRLANRNEPDFRVPDVYKTEFQNQILDFAASNPPRFGVNWACTMDVAIRVTNMIMAYNLFRNDPSCTFESTFDSVFAASIYDHALHIYQNLERLPLRANHSFANIVGLLFASASLPDTQEVQTWYTFASTQLASSMGEQFTHDGANFEGSTSYHRLSAEMAVYGVALVLGIESIHSDASSPLRLQSPLRIARSHVSRSLVSARHFELLERMAEFSIDITKPSGRIHQIGDNDSGRFLKIEPSFRRIFCSDAFDPCPRSRERQALSEGGSWQEDHLDHRHLVSAINGLFDRTDFRLFAGPSEMDCAIIRMLAGGVRAPSFRNGPRDTIFGGFTSSPMPTPRRPSRGTMPSSARFEIMAPGVDLTSNLRLFIYADFGLFIYRSSRLYLALRCGPVGQNGLGGHAHNDQLCLELNLDGEDLIVDPGSYIYTAIPSIRNQYRSVTAHFVPTSPGPHREPGRLDCGLFSLPTRATAVCEECLPSRWLGHLLSPDWRLSERSRFSPIAL